MKKPKRVLVAPLNWGLGHATRSIPIIDNLLLNGFEVILASDGRSLQLLKKEFPDLQTVELPTYNISYSTNNMIFNIAYQIPKIIFAVWRESRVVKKIVKKEKIDIIISDNRYGCRSDHTKNIFITHQINIIVPAKPLRWVVNKFNHILINRFDECWVPDYSGNNSLAGKLSKSDKIKSLKYLGLLSRMKTIIAPQKFDIIAILSGPEPQRTRLEKIIVDELKGTVLKSLVVQGCTEIENRFHINENIEVVSYLESKELSEAMQSSKLVICRSGYSSIMDLVKLRKQAILIPTPGQTEQEYLGKILKDKGLFCVQDQSTFSIESGLLEINQYRAIQETDEVSDMLNQTILTLNT